MYMRHRPPGRGAWIRTEVVPGVWRTFRIKSPGGIPGGRRCEIIFVDGDPMPPVFLVYEGSSHVDYEMMEYLKDE